MIAKSRRLMLLMSLLAKAVVFSLMVVLGDVFRRRPRPSSAPLVSGIAPGEGRSTRPLSETQLRQLEAWLRLRQRGWRRDIIPPVNYSYMVQVEHSDGTTTFVLLFSRMRSAIYFKKFNAGRFDAGWPTTEVGGLIALLREEA
jgi:hypothetical protein